MTAHAILRFVAFEVKAEVCTPHMGKLKAAAFAWKQTILATI